MFDVKIFAILIAIFCLNSRFVLSDDEADYCYADDEHPYLQAGTKTGYHFSHGLVKNTTVSNCEPVQIWMLIRHGTRYPGKDEIKKMQKKLPKLQRKIIANHKKDKHGELCLKDLQKLQTWEIESGLDKSKHKFLAKQGENELLSLGARFKHYFPQLLQSEPDDTLENRYKFRATNTQRTIASMNHFINGAFGNATIDNTEVVPTSEDTLLKVYKTCKPWLEDMKNSSTAVEVNNFINGTEFNQVIGNVSRRLGFADNLSLDDVLIIYTACTFENAWYIDKRSPWCAAFTKDEMRIFEYESDLHYYYRSSYGEKMSSAVGCPPLQDMFNHFTKLENGESKEEPQGIFYFAHSATVQLLLTSMGIAKDSTPPTASNFEDMENRKWNTSRLVPFAANLAAVFYKCDSSNKVRFYLNEKPVDYEGCEMGVCDWEYLKEKMGPNAFNSGTFKMNASVLFLLFLISHVYTRDVDYCFVDEDDPYLYMATKTAYHFVHAGKTRFQDVPNCKAKQVWMLATHGTQCASEAEIIQMLTLTELQSHIINNHETRNNGHMCNRDLENLKRWTPSSYLRIERAEVLTPQGVEDMRLLGRRLHSNFPELLSSRVVNLTEDKYVMKTTHIRNSLFAFMEGLFEDRNAVQVEEVPENDTLLTTYKSCNVWDNEHTNASIQEVISFEEGPEFQNLVQNVSRRLGFLYDVPKELILTIYDICRYEKAWTVTKLSPWCAVFSKEELRVLEYREDLYYYYKAGYGREINAQLGCTLLQDMMNHFWKMEQDTDSNEPKGIFYFSDIVSLQNLLTTLNINKDQMQLTAFNYKHMAKRQWRTSFISPIAANLIATFYKCDSINQPNKVMFYLAEKLVLLDGCDVGLCDWEYIKQKFNPVLKHCSLNVCWNGNGAAAYIPNFVLVLLLCFSLVFVRK
ncbi:Multiple inositol polyphosphate phosphatase 1 [Habropoda laboriosa]|uniref:Multiple inositol polyphosphate phosphatase 1 n=1 Tax=Habropoda laboriosa TaxID=597456 RepID=A0A0L7QR89_9HYME|nr:Multiple inositol polyphosphate phosphatase 1 [Habropoda laboriosa]